MGSASATSSMGAYWAYTFPLAALATAATTCATDDGESDGRAVPTALAWALSVAALAMLLSVATRMCIHARAVHRGTDSWPDPLFVAPPGDAVALDDEKA